jgi:hypothetical protein
MGSVQISEFPTGGLFTIFYRPRARGSAKTGRY